MGRGKALAQESKTMGLGKTTDLDKAPAQEGKTMGRGKALDQSMIPRRTTSPSQSLRQDRAKCKD